LRSNDLFSVFSQEALERLVDRFELRTARRGDELVRQGEASRGLWVVLRGRVCPYDVPTGEEYPELREGAVFGEISLRSPSTHRVPMANGIIDPCVRNGMRICGNRASAPVAWRTEDVSDPT